jgi:hypothetical protein
MGKRKRERGRPYKGVLRKGKAPTKREAADESGGVARGNQWQSTKRQEDWLRFYMDPKEKETFGNSYQSAIKAGYSESYARNIMTPSLALQWVQQAKNIMRLNPEHLKYALAKIITDTLAKDSDKIAAIKLLGSDQGMFVPKQIVAVTTLEQALQELE